jgi:hypothetical protein
MVLSFLGGRGRATRMVVFFIILAISSCITPANDSGFIPAAQGNISVAGVTVLIRVEDFDINE